MKDLINSSIQSHSEALNLIDEKKIHHASDLIIKFFGVVMVEVHLKQITYQLN